MSIPRVTFLKPARDPVDVLGCEECELRATEDCTKENCLLIHEGHDPIRYSEDEA